MNTENPIMRDQREIDSNHLKILSIFYYITSVMSILGIGFLYVHYLIFSKFLADPKFGKEFAQNSQAFPVEIFSVLKWFYLIFGLIAIIAGLLNFIAGRFIQKRTNKNAIFAIACINCLQMPFGTILGAATIFVLLRETVKIQFSENMKI